MQGIPLERVVDGLEADREGVALVDLQLGGLHLAGELRRGADAEEADVGVGVVQPLAARRGEQGLQVLGVGLTDLVLVAVTFLGYSASDLLLNRRAP